MATRPARRSYRAEMRSAIDTRHQPSNVKAPGAAGSEKVVAGAGIGNEQNRLTPGLAGTGSRSGAKGGPSEHPQNHLSPAEGSQAEESLETPAQEQAEQRAGVGDSNVAGPRAVGSATEPIPHAGTGDRGTGFAGNGESRDHAQNRIAASRAGAGANGRGGAGGGAQGRAGQAQNRVLPVKAKHNRDPGGEQPKKSLAGAIKRPGALTARVGGKPSDNLSKVRAIAAKGSPLAKRQAGFYLNVLSK